MPVVLRGVAVLQELVHLLSRHTAVLETSLHQDVFHLGHRLHYQILLLGLQLRAKTVQCADRVEPDVLHRHTGFTQQALKAHMLLLEDLAELLGQALERFATARVEDVQLANRRFGNRGNAESHLLVFALFSETPCCAQACNLGVDLCTPRAGRLFCAVLGHQLVDLCTVFRCSAQAGAQPCAILCHHRLRAQACDRQLGQVLWLDVVHRPQAQTLWNVLALDDRGTQRGQQILGPTDERVGVRGAVGSLLDRVSCKLLCAELLGGVFRDASFSFFQPIRAFACLQQRVELVEQLLVGLLTKQRLQRGVCSFVLKNAVEAVFVQIVEHQEDSTVRRRRTLHAPFSFKKRLASQLSFVIHKAYQFAVN